MKFREFLVEKKKEDEDEFVKRFRKLSPEAGSKKKRQYGAGGGFVDPKHPGLKKPSKGGK